MHISLSTRKAPQKIGITLSFLKVASQIADSQFAESQIAESN
jgi:hypothetical protein